MLRPIQGQANQKTVFLKEIGPRFINQKTIRLKTVPDCLVPSVSFLEFHCLLDERETHQRRLSSLPAEGNLFCALRHDLTNRLLQDFLTHAMRSGFVKKFSFFQVETVSTGHVTIRSGGLYQDGI
jgi:hypothetical protein